MNRIRALSTWLAVLIRLVAIAHCQYVNASDNDRLHLYFIPCSKLCSLSSPFFLAAATNYLVAGHFEDAAIQMIIYAVLRLMTSFFKELQSLLYVKVKQQASIELQGLTFSHLHSLSLSWHLAKKTGSVIKNMDRGVDAANQVRTFLVPDE